MSLMPRTHRICQSAVKQSKPGLPPVHDRVREALLDQRRRRRRPPWECILPVRRAERGVAEEAGKNMGAS